MKDIKERAEEYYINYCVQDTATGYDAYIAGYDDATKKAFNWFMSNYGYFLDNHHNPINSDEYFKHMN